MLPFAVDDVVTLHYATATVPAVVQWIAADEQFAEFAVRAELSVLGPAVPAARLADGTWISVDDGVRFTVQRLDEPPVRESET